MGTYNIIINKTAHADIDNIYNYCCNISVEYAFKVKTNIIVAINSILYFPYASPIYIIFQNIVFRKKIVDKRYLIIFSIFEDSIIIHRIYDGRRNINPASLFNTN